MKNLLLALTFGFLSLCLSNSLSYAQVNVVQESRISHDSEDIRLAVNLDVMLKLMKESPVDFLYLMNGFNKIGKGGLFTEKLLNRAIENSKKENPSNN